VSLDATSSAPAAFQPGGWSLAEILPAHDEATIQAELAALNSALEGFEARRAALDPEMAPALLIDVVRDYEKLVERLYRIEAYGELWFSEDTLSPEALAYHNRAQQVVMGAVNRTLFFELWWKSLSDDEAAALLPPATSHPDERHFLADMRRTRPYTLDEKSEQIINRKDADGVSALLTLYTMLTNRLEFTLDVDGEKQTLTRDALMSYVQGPEPALRAAAYQELYRVYAGEAPLLAQVYTNRVRDWQSEQVELRGYPSPISVRNVANDIPDAAVDALLNVCRRNAGIFQRYFKLKAGWLGMEKLRRYDIYAPLGASDKRMEFGDAVDLVLRTFEQFSPEVAAQAQRVFDEQHIDSAVRKGKRGGAFCLTVLPSLTPFVQMSYTGRVRDVATLAHELGHAIHSMQADQHTVLTQHAVLPLAETASVFAEQLLTDALLAQESDPLVRRELLAAAVDDAYATVMRQAFFVLFEREAHQAIIDNKSPAELNALYMGLLKEMFGDSVEIAPEFEHEWVSIPHIYYTPFYCYAYAFGQLLVLALYRRFQEEGEAFKPGYLKLLAYGGSERPEIILQEAAIDIADEAFWQGGFDVIAGMIDEMERTTV
jgi:oligoendopeptidase F